MSWVSVKDQLPPPPPENRQCGSGSPVENTILVFDPEVHRDPDFPGHSIYTCNREYVRKDPRGITHWMELPEPPK